MFFCILCFCIDLSYIYIYFLLIFISGFVIRTNLPSSILVCMPCHNTFFSSTLSLFWLNEFLSWTFDIYLFFLFLDWPSLYMNCLYLTGYFFTSYSFHCTDISNLYVQFFFEWKVWYRIGCVYFGMFQPMHYVLSVAHLFASQKYNNLFNII